MAEHGLCLFALEASRAYGERIAAHLGVGLAPHEEREFEDGEHKARPLASVRDRDVYVVQSLYADATHSVNDKLCRLLFFLGALRDASAARVTAVLPYLCYARKDRRSKPRDPLTTRYVAALLEAVGIDRVLTLDVHNLAAYQNAFRCVAEHLEARPLLVAHYAARLRDDDVLVLSPDEGGIKRADAFREALARALRRPPAFGFMEKRRSGGVVSGETLFAEARGRSVLIVDDLIGTGTTAQRAARAARAQGAAHVYVAAAHGLFLAGAGAVLADDALDRVAVCDTVPPFRLDPALAARKLDVVDASGLFAEAIRRMHEGGSLVELQAEPG
ncbi:ribose-phosphate pyrophosphokinase [Mizugakiibacter sediminis]|uniref:ribose-phosphate diphosphokinase n=1 Tax=Mizugakiibacter sediminis TaxID=1475481 RepID=A0A0K8QLQ6_9GAMM|nr:ribose-phosphate diphosphokinase [Mizugakiibacter sediminis]GAP65793.1 ribose-phosphate pyrophosphokinase [Mizugakiibacter sediminis]